jgi:hypothetical protein
MTSCATAALEKEIARMSNNFFTIQQVMALNSNTFLTSPMKFSQKLAVRQWFRLLSTPATAWSSVFLAVANFALHFFGLSPEASGVKIVFRIFHHRECQNGV